MAELNLRYVDVVLLDGQRNIRLLVKSALQGIGFGFIHESKTVDEARQFISAINPDLVILDLDIDHADVCAAINDIRHERLGENPFTVIIGLTWHPKPSVLRSALDAGTDDVVKKPISASILTTRITNLIERRKEFIATPDYVGPRRGRGVRPVNEDTIELEVPNSLRLKATTDTIASVDAKAIKRAAQALALQKLYGFANEIATLAEEVEQKLAEGAGNGAVPGGIEQLAGLVTQAKDISATETSQYLPKLVASMTNVMKTIIREGRPPPRRLEILRLHAQAIAATVRGEHDPSGTIAAALGDIVGKALTST